MILFSLCMDVCCVHFNGQSLTTMYLTCELSLGPFDSVTKYSRNALITGSLFNMHLICMYICDLNTA